MFLVGSISAGEKRKKDNKSGEDVDYMALAALLIKDGHYDRAEKALENVDEKDDNLDRPRYFTLKGLVFLNKNIYLEAKATFMKAIKAGQKEKIVFLYLAQSHYVLKEYKEALAALDRPGKEAESMPEIFIIRAECNWRLGRREKAWAALDDGERRFPGHAEFLRRRFFYLIDLGLFQEAARIGELYVSKAEAGMEDYVAIGEALRKSGRYEKALSFLETANLKYPNRENVLITLAHAYMDADKLYTAATLFEQASLNNPGLTIEAAELYRRAGALFRAMYLNAKVGDQKAKLRQRMSILLELGYHEEAVAMADRLSRLGLLKDEDIRYALAFSYYKIWEYEKAETHLKKITRPDLFEKAAQLRKAMAACSSQGWKCIDM